MKKIYGIDPEKEVTPAMVRDAIIECFFQAHCQATELEMGEGDMSKVYCKSLVEKAFEDSGGDFYKPNKESIIKAMGELRKFSKEFRNQGVIEEHTREIMILVDKL